MKVKVKGLVFVGFAAAVFATSAMAADGDGKIVTSKLYVDNKIAATATINYGGSDHANTSTNNTAVTGTGTVGTVKYTKISNDSSDIDETAGENVLVTGKAVAGAIGTAVGDYQPKAPTTDSTSLYLGHNTQATSGGTTTNTADWKKLEAAATGTQASTDYVTIKEDSGVYKINIPTAQLTSATTDFTGTVTNGVWGGPGSTQKAKLVKAETINSLINKETTVGTTTITDAAAGNTTVPTSKNVYDFVTNAISDAAGDYQPKVDNSNAGKLMVGFNTATTSNGTTTYSSDWKKLEDAVTGTQASTDYVTIKEDSGVYKINIPTAQLATAATGLVNANDTSGAVTALTSTTKVKLVEAQAVEALVAYETSVGTTTITSANSGNGKVPTVKNVYDFVDSNKLKAGSTTGGTIGSNSSDDSKVPTVKNVVEYVTGLTGGLTIPVPTGDCAYGTNGITSSNGVACALVLAYDANAGGTGVAGVSLQWIPMAQ